MSQVKLEIENDLHQALSLLKLLNASLDSAIESLPCDHNSEPVELLLGCSALSGMIAVQVAALKAKIER